MKNLLDSDLNRRDFLKLSMGSLAALGLSALDIPGFTAALQAAVAEIPVVWFLAGTCSGCSVSIVNTVSPNIKEILIDEVIPGVHLNVLYQPVIMAGQGHQVIEVLKEARDKGGFVLVVEGVVGTKDEGVYCRVGEENGKEKTALEWITELGSSALLVLPIGACATYGGVPGSAPNVTGVKGVAEIFKERGVATPVVNIPGCPPHPDWFVGTVATALLVLSGGGGIPETVQALGGVDDYGRPKVFYGQLVHDHCERRADFDEGRFAKQFGEPGCLYELGCKGPVTYADCPARRWNNKVSWCVGCGHGCIGCTEPIFVDGVSPLRARVSGVTLPGVRTNADRIGIGLAAATAVGIGAHLVGSAARGRLGKGAEE
ncbi:MAG: hydrogenase small subunit [Anaerolineae bacterium]